jgi:hypothetical protein
VIGSKQVTAAVKMTKLSERTPLYWWSRERLVRLYCVNEEAGKKGLDEK